DILPQLEKQMLKFLGAERLTIYQRGRNGREIISRYKTGAEVREIRLPISPSSIAGYVALTQQSLNINNVHERSLLASIHPELEFDRSFDASTGFHTRSMITVPIKQGDTPLGVLQVINCVGKNAFDDLDLKSVEDLARVIGQ
ncbi:MAG TPA: general secretion pathway protein GspE, partial [Syntrophobacteraceae bacterium]|nr:general secretion pathway protein GspE [Syntrophobacteraceae bacterium]